MCDVIRKIPSIPGHVTTRNIGDEAVVMDLETLKTYTLNETARTVWGLMDGTRSVEDIVECMLADFDVAADECRESVVELVNSLAAERLVVFADPCH
jgi:hypothetical protein